jgi:trigger factor
VRKAFDKAYRELGRSVRVRGFRPGKAPRSVLERLYGASLSEELERQLVSETLAEAVDQSGVSPVSEPSIDATPPRPDTPFRYTASVEVKPEMTLPPLGGLPVTRPPVFVGDEDVEREIESLRQRHAPLVDEPEATAASQGSTLVVDYVGRIDGEVFEGGTAQGSNVELGAGRLLPGFEEQLEGVTADEDREVRVTFPDDYPSQDVAGKDAVFAVHVVKVQRREVPDLDDAFVKGLGELESVEELRAKILEDLTRARESHADEEARRTLMDALIERTAFEVPPGMVDRRLEQRLSAAHQQLAQAMPHEELHDRLSQWREQWRPAAEREVRETLLLEAVADAQELAAETEEVDARLDQMARDQGIDPARLRKAYEERDLLEALGERIREEKALAFLLAEAKVEETAGT